MTESGRRSFKERLALSEFKHPGKFGIRGSVQKKGRKPIHNTSNSLTLKEIDQRIVAFIQSGDAVTQLSFQLVSRALCRTIANLAKAYCLECVVEQKRRLPVASPILKKTPHSRMASRMDVKQILRNHGRDSPNIFCKNGGTITAVQQDDERVAAVVVPVGGKAPPLDESNRGNRMLQGMGWKPGMGLGPEGNGVRNPILAYVRPRHMGLGY